jgi:hypothetical protein
MKREYTDAGINFTIRRLPSIREADQIATELKPDPALRIRDLDWLDDEDITPTAAHKTKRHYVSRNRLKNGNYIDDLPKGINDL